MIIGETKKTQKKPTRVSPHGQKTSRNLCTYPNETCPGITALEFRENKLDLFCLDFFIIRDYTVSLKFVKFFLLRFFEISVFILKTGGVMYAAL